MRTAFRAAVLVVLFAAWSRAQDVRQPADWKGMYQDVSAQLRAAQDRKSELAAQNAKLTSAITQLESELNAARAEATALRGQMQGQERQTYLLHAFYTGWEAFIQSDPTVLDRWAGFWGQRVPVWPVDPVILCDPRWPRMAP